MRGFHQWQWHLDEMYVKLNGEMVYLWRAVDQEGEILESYVTRKRDKAAALVFMKKALKRHGSPETSPPTACVRILQPGPSLAVSRSRRWAAGRTTGWRTRTCRSDDENG